MRGWYVAASMFDWISNWYVFGFVVTWLLTFIGGWTYCTVSYGFLWGFGFGWLASAIAATIAGVFWPLPGPFVVLWVAWWIVGWVVVWIAETEELNGLVDFMEDRVSPVLETLVRGLGSFYVILLFVTAVYLVGTCFAGWKAPTRIDTTGKDRPVLECPFPTLSDRFGLSFYDSNNSSGVTVGVKTDCNVQHLEES